MFPLNFLPLFLHLFFLWRCHLWYIYSLFGYLYHYWHYLYQCWHCKWCHSAPHHFLCFYFYVFLFPLNSITWGSTFFSFILPFKNTSWRFYCNLPSIFQCCLHLLLNSLYLGQWFLWIFLLVNKQTLKVFCQYQRGLIGVLCISLIFLAFSLEVRYSQDSILSLFNKGILRQSQAKTMYASKKIFFACCTYLYHRFNSLIHKLLYLICA
jgi:hypothetical protein